MAEVNFDEIKQGMSPLEVVKAYPEAAVKAMEKMQAELAQLSHNNGYAAALWGELVRICPGTGKIEKVNSVVVTEERLNFAIKALQNCA
jgi:hypothetical protein